MRIIIFVILKLLELVGILGIATWFWYIGKLVCKEREWWLNLLGGVMVHCIILFVVAAIVLICVCAKFLYKANIRWTNWLYKKLRKGGDIS